MTPKLCCVVNTYLLCHICSTRECYSCWMKTGKMKHYSIHSAAVCPVSNKSGIMEAEQPPFEIKYA